MWLTACSTPAVPSQSTRGAKPDCGNFFCQLYFNVSFLTEAEPETSCQLEELPCLQGATELIQLCLSQFGWFKVLIERHQRHSYLRHLPPPSMLSHHEEDVTVREASTQEMSSCSARSVCPQEGRLSVGQMIQVRLDEKIMWRHLYLLQTVWQHRTQ